MHVEPLHPLGVRVTDVDLRSDKHCARLRSLVWAHGLVLLPAHAAALGAPAPHEDDSLELLATLCGEPERGHPIVPGKRYAEDPVLELRTGGDAAPRPDSYLHHVDYSYRATPSSAATLCAKQLPPEGGGLTCFRSAHAMYKSLDPDTRDRLKGLVFEHSLRTGYTRSGRAEEANAVAEQSAVHPAVVSHPVTGVPLLFLNPMYTTMSKELGEQDSVSFLERVYEIAEKVPVYKHKWTVDDVLLWDNVGIQHMATADYRSLRIMTGTTSCRDDFAPRAYSDSASDSSTAS